jgi:hypothetical protein
MSEAWIFRQAAVAVESLTQHRESVVMVHRNAAGVWGVPELLATSSWLIALDEWG